MNPEAANLAIKIVILLFLAATSQLAMHKRQWTIALFCTAVWLNLFRLSILRAMMLYIGVFKKETPAFIQASSDVLRSGAIANITDILVLIAVILTFITLAGPKDEH